MLNVIAPEIQSYLYFLCIVELIDTHRMIFSVLAIPYRLWGTQVNIELATSSFWIIDVKKRRRWSEASFLAKLFFWLSEADPS